MLVTLLHLFSNILLIVAQKKYNMMYILRARDEKGTFPVIISKQRRTKKMKMYGRNY